MKSLEQDAKQREIVKKNALKREFSQIIKEKARQ